LRASIGWIHEGQKTSWSYLNSRGSILQFTFPQSFFMKSIYSLFLLFILAASQQTYAQKDPFVGTWAIEKLTNAGENLFMELQVGSPDQALLYPAQLTINYKSFNGIYHLLLVKKGNQQLAISRNKHPVKEEPYSLGNYTIYLNGTLNYQMETGKAALVVERIPAKRFGVALPAVLGYPEEQRLPVIQITDLLKTEALSLKQINNRPWLSAAIPNIVHTSFAPAYFGLIDTFHTKSALASISFSENNVSDNDSISVSFNGKMIIDKIDVTNRTPAQNIKLDTGLNILCFFAENYGRVPPNTVKLNLRLGEGLYALDFTETRNISATFIVAEIFYYPDGRPPTAKQQAERKIFAEKIQHRVTRQIDSITAAYADITLAIWDDAIEDGDSISLQINNEIFMPGIAVKKKPLFIPVKLYPGENKIIFIADNLGSIPPNTAILEIIDGKRRKSYMINTNLGQNNSIKIMYEYKPGD
jgi:hypothetical protein